MGSGPGSGHHAIGVRRSFGPRAAPHKDQSQNESHQDANSNIDYAPHGHLACRVDSNARHIEKPPVHRRLATARARALVNLRNTGGHLDIKVRLGSMQGDVRDAGEPPLLQPRVLGRGPPRPEPAGQAASATPRVPSPGRSASRPTSTPQRMVSSSPMGLSPIDATGAMERFSGPPTSSSSSAPSRAAGPSGRAAGECDVATLLSGATAAIARRS